MVHLFLTLHFSTLNTHQTIEISIHPVPSKEFDSDLEDDSDQDVAMVGVRMATLSITPPHDIVLFETEPESGYEVTSVGSGPAAGPILMMALPNDNIIISRPNQRVTRRTP